MGLVGLCLHLQQRTPRRREAVRGTFLPAGLIQTLLAKTRKLIVIYKLLFIRWPPILKEFIFSLMFSRLEGGKCIDDYFR